MKVSIRLLAPASREVAGSRLSGDWRDGTVWLRQRHADRACGVWFNDCCGEAPDACPFVYLDAPGGTVNTSGVCADWDTHLLARPCAQRVRSFICERPGGAGPAARRLGDPSMCVAGAVSGKQQRGAIWKD